MVKLILGPLLAVRIDCGVIGVLWKQYVDAIREAQREDDFQRYRELIDMMWADDRLSAADRYDIGLLTAVWARPYSLDDWER